MPPAEIIRSRSNSLVRRLRGLKQKTEHELCLIEGPKLLGEALEAGLDIVEVAATPRFERSGDGPALVARLRRAGIEVRWLEDDLLASLSETETSAGLVALARRPVFAESALIRGPGTLVLVAVAIQNPGNLGGLFRTAEAARATGVYLTAETADPLSWKALRGSMGSAFRLPHVQAAAPGALLTRLHEGGMRVVATVAEGGTAYTEARLTGPVAIVLGSEGAGLDEDVLRHADERVTIPLSPPVESLNVGVAAGILLFEAVRQRGKERT
jgi:TrmH family RNA methyltransferase